MGLIRRIWNKDMLEMDPRTEHRLVMYEYFCVLCVFLCAFAAVGCIIAGAIRDTSENGGVSFKVQIDQVQKHTQPTFTFCSIGANETLAPLLYCEYNERLYFSDKHPPPVRAWGNDTHLCSDVFPTPGVIKPHPLDPTCWMIGNDTAWLLMPQKGKQNVQFVFLADGMSVNIWNSTDLASKEFPRNSTEAQGLRGIFGAGDMVQITESTYKRIQDADPQVLFSLNQAATYSLTFEDGLILSSITLFWETDSVERIEEQQTVSTLTLAAIILGIAAVVFDVAKDMVILSFTLFVYPARMLKIENSKTLDTQFSKTSVGLG